MAKHHEKPGIKIPLPRHEEINEIHSTRDIRTGGIEIAPPQKERMLSNMKYVYPAIFTPLPSGEYDVRIPDLPGGVTCGKDLADAIEMAEDAIAMWLCDAEDNQETIPTPSEKLIVDPPQFVNLIVADTGKYRRENDYRAVKKTLSIPSWLNAKAEKAGVNFSQILQEALKNHLGIRP